MPAAAVAKCLRRLRGRVGVSNIDRVRMLPPLDEIIFGYSTVTVMMIVMIMIMIMIDDDDCDDDDDDCDEDDDNVAIMVQCQR